VFWGLNPSYAHDRVVLMTAASLIHTFKIMRTTLKRRTTTSRTYANLVDGHTWHTAYTTVDRLYTNVVHLFQNLLHKPITVNRSDQWFLILLGYYLNLRNHCLYNYVPTTY